MRVAVVGTGRMGTAVAREAERRGHAVVALIGRGANPGGAALTDAGLGQAEVVFEFTRPEAVVANLERLLTDGRRVVTGTTGWGPELGRISDLATRHGGALLHAANFSPGMQLLRAAARTLAQLLATRPEFDAAIRESHHRRKVDAPSGSALALQHEVTRVDASRPYPITSERVGWVPGTHALVLDAEHEQITVTHAVRDRVVFATGAVIAGEWLSGRTGVFTFDHVITGAEP